MSLLALTDAQISTWVASFMLPLFRVGALLTTMPIIGTTLVPKRIKLFLSLAITLAIMPSLPPLPTVNPLDLSGLMLIAEQIIIGALLVVNIAFGVMTRAAPQLNIFAIGFPLTLVLGMVILWISMADILNQYQPLASEALQFLRELAQAK